MSENEEYEVEFYRNEIQNSLDMQTEKFKPEIKNTQDVAYTKTNMLEFTNEMYRQMIECEDQEGSIIINFGKKSFKLYVSKSELIKIFNNITDKKKDELAELIDPAEFRANGADAFGMVSFVIPNMISNAKAMQKVGYKYMPLTYSMNNRNYATFMGPEIAIEWLKNIKPRDMFEAMGQANSPSEFFKNLGLQNPAESKEEENSNEESSDDKKTDPN